MMTQPNMLPFSARAATYVLMLCVLALSARSYVSAGEAKRIQSTRVAAQALTFAEGSAAKFSQSVNGRSHQQTPLTTYRGYQYVTYYDAERRLCIGRRKLPSDTWQIIQFKDHKFLSNDSHNTAVLGICDKDGTIHLAFDHHATPLNYRVSKRGAAHDPESVLWNTDLFGPITHSLGSVATNPRVTYPRFFSTPSGNLMLFYRAVTSGNGDGMIEEYDGDSHDWTPGLGKIIARDIGTYTAGDQTSLYRCPYMNSLSYAGQRLHASWVWRDRFDRTNSKHQHDLCYAYSDDDGRTWLNSDGVAIGKTGQEFIHLDSPGLVVVPIDSFTGLANQNTHYAFEDGSFHAVMRRRPQDAGKSCYHHYWRTSEGHWHEEALPFTGDRPKVVGANDGSLVLVYTDEDLLYMAEGKPTSAPDRWQWISVRLPKPHSIYGDAVLDLERWEDEAVLSIYGQEEPFKIMQTDLPGVVDGFSSPLNVVDYRITQE